jgi:hypothetical protein
MEGPDRILTRRRRRGPQGKEGRGASCRNSHRRAGQEPAAILVDYFGSYLRTHVNLHH